MVRLLILVKAQRRLFCSRRPIPKSAVWRRLARSSRGTDQLRIANLLSLSHPYSVDLYCDAVLTHARVIVVRLLGGVSYWSYGAEQLSQLARAKNIPLRFCPVMASLILNWISCPPSRQRSWPALMPILPKAGWGMRRVSRCA